MKKEYWVIGIVLLMTGGLSFFGGMQYQKTKLVSMIGRGGQQNVQGTNRPRTMGNGGGGMQPVNGEIMNVDATTATIKLADGSSKLVILSALTKVTTSTEASMSALVAGEQVTAFGTVNPDGSVTAQTISLGNDRFPR